MGWRARNSARGTTSSGSLRHSASKAWSTGRSSGSRICPVSTGPGISSFTLMLNSRSSCASTRVSIQSAAFEQA